MNVKILALVLITTLVHSVFVSGYKQVKKKGHHAFKAERSKIPVGRINGELKTKAKVREQKRTYRTEKKLTALKSSLFRADNEKEVAQNELLAKELALSSDIGEVKRNRLKAWSKKYSIQRRTQRRGKISERRRNVITDPLIYDAAAEKRTSISLPSAASSRSLPEQEAPLSRTLLTAVGLLFNERNHFEKDSNALTLAKVLLDNDKNASAKHSIHGSDSINSASPSIGLSNILRLLNASLSGETQGGERKSTIHTELINPTELGVSILRLLFGHKAPLVMKPTYKPLFRNNPTSRVSSVINPVVSSSSIRLAPQSKQSDTGKEIARKKHHKKSFSFALAKAVSDLIKSMAKEELKNYLQKIHNQPAKPPRIPERFWPSKKKVDVQGDRKSWVLLKIPKAGQETVPQQTMADDLVADKDTKEEKSSTGIVDTLGKLNDANPLPLETADKNAGSPSRSGVNNDVQKYPIDVKTTPTSRVGYSVRILPSLKGSTGKQTDVSHVNDKPATKPQISAQTTAAFVEAVKKLLNAVQSSIKTIQGKQLIGKPQNVGSIVSDRPPNVASIVSDQPSKVAERTNTGSIRGMNNDLTSINEFQPNKREPVLEDIQAKKETSTGELSAFTRATGHGESLAHGNVIFDPLKELEPITKSISPTKRLGPSQNVIFESTTELGTPRNKQDSTNVEHIQEDLETFAEKGLQTHNHYREEHHSPHLRWSDELAIQAEKLAYDMATRGTVERSEVTEAMGYGENVAKITGVPFNDAGSVATDVWYSESANYSYSYPRVTPQTDAFTQMVWKETKEIGMGCAKDVATNDIYVVALYRPPGNDRRRLRENVLKKGLMTEDVYATIFKRTQ